MIILLLINIKHHRFYCLGYFMAQSVVITYDIKNHKLLFLLLLQKIPINIEIHKKKTIQIVAPRFTTMVQ